MKLEHRLNALASNVAELSPGRPGSFYVWLENRFEAATKTHEHKRFGLWNCVSFVLGDKKGLGIPSC